MSTKQKNKSTREGPASGESLDALDSQRIGPDVYGGANLCFLGVGKNGTNGKEDGNTQGADSGEEGTKKGEIDKEKRGIPVDMDLTGSSDSEPSGRRLRSSKTRGQPKQSPVGCKKRRYNPPPSMSEAEDAETVTPSPQVGKRAGEFLKPRALDGSEEEIQEMARAASLARASLGISTSVDSATLIKQVADDVDVINQVASKSRNLKGTFTRALKDASKSIKEAVEALGLKFSTEETARLQAENAHLRREVGELRKEVADMRKEMRKDRSPTSVSSPSENSAAKEANTSANSQVPQPADELARSIMIQVGIMLDARMASLEQRLPPEERLRPPLAADARNKPQQPTRKKGEKTGTGSESAKQSGTATQNLASEEQGWTKIGKGGKKVTNKTAPKTKTSGSAAKPVTKWKLRPPRSAAVIITLQPGAEEKGISYSKVLSEAKTKIDLSGLGIPAVRFRRAVSGARVLEIPGGSSGEMADSLAKKLREIIPEDMAKVSRPVKCADLRIHGLDDSVEQNDVAAAIAVRVAAQLSQSKWEQFSDLPRALEQSGSAVLLRLQTKL